MRSGDATPREPTPEEAKELAELREKLEKAGKVLPEDKRPPRE
jgi:hypothetical protein